MENNHITSANTTSVVANRAMEEVGELAVQFLDILDFTGLMESQPEQMVIQVVRRLFTAFNQIVKKFEGKVVEIAGDSLYAVFGLQTGISDAVNNAYQAAKGMFQAINLFNEAYAEPYYGRPLEIGVGLHAGKVFVGEFAALGDGDVDAEVVAGAGLFVSGS